MQWNCFLQEELKYQSHKCKKCGNNIHCLSHSNYCVFRELACDTITGDVKVVIIKVGFIKTFQSCIFCDQYTK